jgi:trimethylamine--corrinoid protein Co-methyltransferase
MRILETSGIAFHNTGALKLWAKAGGQLDEERVRIPRELLLDLIAGAPSSFTVGARNSAHAVPVGGERCIFTPAYGPPYVRDFQDRRRVSTLVDLEAFYKLVQLSPALHVAGGPVVEPVDVPVPQRHLDLVYAQFALTDKPVMGAVTARERAEDSVAMARIVFGDEIVEQGPVMLSLVNCNSPLVWDEAMVDALTIYAANNQAVICAPFVLAGASTPTSVTASVAQLNAEALAGVAYTQLVRPGAPAVYGCALHGVSMKTGAPMLGTPELGHMNLMIGQLARRYQLPWRSCSQWTSAHALDVQSGYESLFTTLSALLAGPNILMHAAGIIENNLSTSFSKFVLDQEQIEQIYLYAQGADFDGFDEALETVLEVGPGGHFLATAHTREHMLYHPSLQDTRSYDEWEALGSRDAVDRAREHVQVMLSAYQQPALDGRIDSELRRYVERRRLEVGTEVR